MSMSCGTGCGIFQKLCNVLLCGAVLAVVVAFSGAGSASGRCLCAWKSLLIVFSTGFTCQWLPFVLPGC